MAQEEEAPSGVPEWVVTFGDMMSLLLTFFIMLVSLSEIKEEKKYQALVDSLRRQFGYDMSRNAIIPGRAKPRNAALAKLSSAGRARKLDIMQGGTPEEAPEGDYNRVRVIRAGERSAVGTVVTFAENAIDLNESQKADLQLLLAEIGGKPQIIEVRGHSSLRPATDFSEYKDNFELSYQRARATAQYLVDELGIDRRRIRISAAGANEPLYQSTDPAQLARNARVEVFLTDETIDEFRSLDSGVAPALHPGSGK